MTRLAIVALTASIIACTPKARETPDAPGDAAIMPSADAGARDDGGLREDAGARGSANGFGTATFASRVLCAGEMANHVADVDLRASFVDGDDLLAIVNRSPTGGLAPSYAPVDLVDLVRHEPRTASACDGEPCLRREAALALDELLAAMKAQRFEGKVESAYRSYGFQCGTFENWVKKSKRKTTEAAFCDAAEQSALPGHSQHQLGTAIDLFTEEWAKDDRGVFRQGFGCTPAGTWIREHAWEHGFVLPYPLHPDDRHPKQACTPRWDIHVDINPKTGYRYEHWHLRFLGKAAASAFHAAWEQSGPGTPDELTLEQWLRGKHGGLVGDAELPVCDDCNCGACATLARPGLGTCEMGKGPRGATLHLGDDGLPLPAEAAPSLVGAQVGKARKNRKALVVEVVVDLAPNTLTQPPITGREGASYGEGATFEALAPYPDTKPRAFPPLERAWVIGVEPEDGATTTYPYRAALADTSLARVYNRANVRLPTRRGTVTVRLEVPATSSRWKVSLLEAGIPKVGPLLVDVTP